jgi:hypothetical protein
MCIAVAPRNHDVLDELVHNITTPWHSMHRRHLSYDEAHGSSDFGHFDFRPRNILFPCVSQTSSKYPYFYR